MKNDSQFLFGVGRVRSKEANLLTSADIDRLVTAKNTVEAVQILTSKGWSIDGDDFESGIRNEKKELIGFMNEILNGDELDSLLIYNDFLNCKTGIKASVANIDASKNLLAPSVYDSVSVYDLSYKHEFADLPETLCSAATAAYDVLSRSGSVQLCDSILDKACLESQISLAKKTDCKTLIDLAETKAKMCDIKVSFRCAVTGKDLNFAENATAECDAFPDNSLAVASSKGAEEYFAYMEKIGYGELIQMLRDNPTLFDKYSDDMMTECIMQGKSTMFGIDPIIAYYVAKNTELTTVRIVLSGKKNDLGVDEIKKRVRNSYV